MLDTSAVVSGQSCSTAYTMAALLDQGPYLVISGGSANYTIVCYVAGAVTRQ
jgi:hypothetical protein